MDYEKAYKEALERAKEINNEHRAQPFDVMTRVFSELRESEGEKIRKELVEYFKHYSGGDNISIKFPKWIAWLEKQGEHKSINDTDEEIVNAVKDTSVLDLVEPKPAWSEEDETALCDALWAMKQAAKIAKDENDMGNIWYAENWLKSLKDRMKGE